ncbi:MAG: cupin domain-containing protein [Nodosilinea sp.]
MQSIVLSDLKALAVDPELDWEPFRPGVDIHRLYPAEPDGAAAALLRYQPGASVPYHLHTGFEHILVLSGSQVDNNGTYAAGTLVINPPGTRHTVSSPDGCIVLAIWAKPVQIEE